MALTKVTGQVIKNTTDVTVGVLTVTNTLAVGGTVSIGGTLTYEDVTNVDAVGLITARNGIVVGSGITLSKDGDGFFTGIVTATTFSGSLAASNLTGALPAISGANLTNLDASDLASGTVPTARLGSGTASSSTFLRGDSTFAAVTSTTINNNADNRLITGSGTANTLEGEANLTFNGQKLSLGPVDGGSDVVFSARSNNSGGYGAYIQGGSGTNYILRLDDKDQNAYFRFQADGKFGVGTGSPSQHLHIEKDTNGDERVLVKNPNTGSSARAAIKMESDSSTIDVVATSAAYSGVSGWGDAAVISTGSGTSGGLILNSQASSSQIKFQTQATERARINSSGQVFIGDTVNLDSNKVNIFGTKAYSSGIPQQQLAVADAQAYSVTDNGGSIGFLAKYSSGGSYTTMGSIEGVKHNNIDGNYQGAIAFKTRNNNGDNVIRMRLTDNGLCFGTDTAGANALDDYEEGTFDALICGSSNPNTYYVTGTGKYTKIGNKVDVHMSWDNMDMNNSASGNIMIRNLPFTSSTHQYTVTTDHYLYNVGFNTGRIQSWYVNYSASTMQGIESKPDLDWDGWSVGNFTASGTYLRVHVTYLTA